MRRARRAIADRFSAPARDAQEFRSVTYSPVYWLSALFGLPVEDSFEATSYLIQPDIESACNAQQSAEPGVDGSSLQLSYAVELSADSLCQPLLSKASLTTQLLDRLPEGGVVG